MAKFISIEQWAADHEQADERRFASVNDKIDESVKSIPQEVKRILNGSVEESVTSSVQKEMSRQLGKFYLYVGVGSFTSLILFGWYLGGISNQVGNNAGSVNEIRNDIKTLIRER